MTATDDRPPSVTERYNVAVGQGSTRIGARGSSGDVVLAAALQRNRMGAMLLRLQAEYDAARAELEQAGHIAPRNYDQASALLAQAKSLLKQATRAESPRERWRLEAQADVASREAAAIKRRTPHEIVSARAFILLKLKTIREAKLHVGALALRMAAKPHHSVTEDAALKLAGRALDVFLDPLCHNCDGTGRIGNTYAGEAEKACPVCKGSTHRRDVLGNSIRETTFAAVLLGELQRKAAAASRGMVRALMGENEHGVEARADAELQDALRELRSVEAQRD